MIRLAGLRPDRDIEIEFIGLRPGEKLHEELFHAAEPLMPTANPAIRLAAPRTADYAMLARSIDELEEHARARREERVLQLLERLVPEYRRNAPRPECRRGVGGVTRAPQPLIRGPVARRHRPAHLAYVGHLPRGRRGVFVVPPFVCRGGILLASVYPLNSAIEAKELRRRGTAQVNRRSSVSSVSASPAGLVPADAVDARESASPRRICGGSSGARCRRRFPARSPGPPRAPGRSA